MLPNGLHTHKLWPRRFLVTFESDIFLSSNFFFLHLFQLWLVFLCCSYRAYRARKQLIAKDWNFHRGREQAMIKEIEGMVTTKYNRRTKEWNCKVVKVNKGYNYIPVLTAMIFRRRFEDLKSIRQHVTKYSSGAPTKFKRALCAQRAKTRLKENSSSCIIILSCFLILYSCV